MMLCSHMFSPLKCICYSSLKTLKFNRTFSSSHVCYISHFNVFNQSEAGTKLHVISRNNKYIMPLRGLPLLSVKSSSCNNLKAIKSSYIPVRFFSIQSVAETQANLFSFLSQSTPVHYAQMFFESIHDTSGLPWWGSIICTTVLVRAVVSFPLTIYQNYILAKFQNLQVELMDISKELQKEVAFASKKFGWSNEQAQLQYKYSLKKQWDKLVIRDNCHPFKATLPIWFQMPMWVFLSISLRNMTCMLPNRDAAAEILFLQLSVGGCLWFPNLIDIDHTYILPVMLGVINLAIVELQTITKVKKSTRFQRYLTNFFRILSVAMIPIAANVPTCMSLYWVSSSACGLAQNLLVLSPRLKRWAHIPGVKPLPSANEGGPSGLPNSTGISIPPVDIGLPTQWQDHPYRHIASEIQSRIDRVSAKIGIGKAA